MSSKISRKNTELYSLLFVLLGSLFLAFSIIQPYLNVLLAASVVAIIFEPVHRRILRLVRNKESLGALISVLVITVIIIGPLVLIGKQIFEEGQALYAQLDKQSSASIVQEAEKIITKRFGSVGVINVQAVDQMMKNILQYFSDQAGSLFSSVLQLIVRMAIGVFALYYFLKDSDSIRKYILKISPLGEDNTRDVIDNLRLTIQSTIRGSIVVATAQAILLVIGFFVFGVSNPFLWGSVGFIAALVPAVGTTLITIPVAFSLFLQGQTVQAIGFFIWGIFVVGLADNLIRPWLLGRHTGLNPFVIFLSVIGGLSFFGPMGILWGPIILSLLVIMLDSYSKIIDEESAS